MMLGQIGKRISDPRGKTMVKSKTKMTCLKALATVCVALLGLTGAEVGAGAVGNW